MGIMVLGAVGTVEEVQPPIPPSPGEHFHSKNLFGGTKINSVSDLFNASKELYLLNRSWHYVDAQTNFMESASSRVTTVPKYRAMHDANPGLTVTFHGTLHPSFPAHEKNEGVDSRYYKQMNENPRADTLVYRDQDDAPTEIHFSKQSSSSNTNNQASVFFKIANLANRTWAAQYAHDFVTGANLSGWGQGAPGQDISDFAGWFHDTTAIIYPQPSVGLHPVQDKGSVVTIVSTYSGKNWTKEIEIDSDPGLATTGNLDSPNSSYRKVDVVENMGIMRPSGTGFIGHHILGIKDNGDDGSIPLGNSRLFLKQFSGSAANTQDFVPVSGDDWCIADSSSRTTTVDHDSDGIPTGHPASQDTWVDEWDDYWAKITANIQATTGHNTIIGWNGLGASFNNKEADGWPTPFKHSENADAPMNEHGNAGFRFEAKSDTGPHEYDCSNTNVNRGMRNMYWGNRGVRPNPGGHFGNRARGQIYEIEAWGDDYSDLQKQDNSFIRFFHLVLRTLPIPAIAQIELGGRQSVPVAIPECWADFDTGWIQPAELGVYDEDGGSLGPQGRRDLWTFATPDWGEQGYTRRYGTRFLAHMNLADAPPGYNVYAPSHLPGGFTPRTNDDEILPANWTAIQSKYLNPGETLKRWDEANYFSQRATDFYLANAVDDWTGNLYGPYQSHPSDGDGAFTILNNPIIIRDGGPTGLNNNDPVSFTSAYGIGPLECHLHEIIPAP